MSIQEEVAETIKMEPPLSDIGSNNHAALNLTPEKEQEIRERIMQRAELAKMTRQLRFELGKINSPTKKPTNNIKLSKEFSNNIDQTTSGDRIDTDERVSPLKRRQIGQNDNELGEIYNDNNNNNNNNNDDEDEDTSSPTKKYKPLLSPTTPNGSAWNGTFSGKLLKPKLAVQEGMPAYLSDRAHTTTEQHPDDSFQNELGADLLMYLASSPYNGMNAAPSSLLKSRDKSTYNGNSNNNSMDSSNYSSLNNFNNFLQTPSRRKEFDGILNTDGVIDGHSGNRTMTQSNKNLKEQLQKEVIPMTPLTRPRGNSPQKNKVHSNNKSNKVFEEEEDAEEGADDVTEDEMDGEQHILRNHTPSEVLQEEQDEDDGDEEDLRGRSHKYASKPSGQTMISSSPPREFDSPSVYTQLMLFSPEKNAINASTSTNITKQTNTKNKDSRILYAKNSNNGDIKKIPNNTQTRSNTNINRENTDIHNNTQNLLKTPSRPINGPTGSASVSFLPPNSAIANFMMMKTPNTPQLSNTSRLLLDSATANAISSMETTVEVATTSTRADREDRSKVEGSGTNSADFHSAIPNDSHLKDTPHFGKPEIKKDTEQQSNDAMNRNHITNSNFSMGEYMNNLFSPSPRVPSKKNNNTRS